MGGRRLRSRRLQSGGLTLDYIVLLDEDQAASSGDTMSAMASLSDPAASSDSSSGAPATSATGFMAALQ